jgi:uncharacterized OsmC-like protein
MITSKVVYQGELRTEARHMASGDTLITDAPVDNQGKGEAFSPTDLLATSLGACMLTIMGIAARTHSIDIQGAKADVTKVMSPAPRRVQEIIVEIILPGTSYTDKQKQVLENAARTCPVSLSLSPDLKQTINFSYGK